MKIFLQSMYFLFLPVIINAQFLNVYQNDGSVQTFILSHIDSITFTTSNGTSCPGIPTVAYAGKIYNTVQIGNQCWLKENLEVGTMIQGTQNQTNNGTIEKHCYADLESNCVIYGGLYQWDEAMQYVINEGAQGICPEGWHIPTYSEFISLASTVGNNSNALKAIGQGSDWGAGTNESGFSALLGGQHCKAYNNDFFSELGFLGNFWSSTDMINQASSIIMYYDNDIISVYNFNEKTFSYSVRCLKD